MKGPHNIWRIIRTGATFERSGAMGVALQAVEAPRSLRIAARVFGLPFKISGFLQRYIEQLLLELPLNLT